MTWPLDPDVIAHYGVADERVRLSSSAQGRVEYERTQQIVRRVLPAPPARIVDVGGGAGAHATWLAADGYTVELLDPVPLHVRQAREAAKLAARPFSARLGDARRLPLPECSVHVVLLLGPLYHLDSDGRRQAVAEAKRVLRDDGVLVAAAISRFASLLDGLRRGWLADETFAGMVDRDLATGRHHNPDPVGRPEWFTTAWFHRPDELRRELEDAGLAVEAVVAVEGPLWLLNDLDERWRDDSERGRLLRVMQSVEREGSMLGVSAHLLASPAPGTGVPRREHGPATRPCSAMPAPPPRSAERGEMGLDIFVSRGEDRLQPLRGTERVPGPFPKPAPNQRRARYLPSPRRLSRSAF